jgi:hypothetical protein
VPSNVPVEITDAHCLHCRGYIKTKYYLYDASKRGIDAQKCLDAMNEHREHGVMSEAHYHLPGTRCNERCVV